MREFLQCSIAWLCCAVAFAQTAPAAGQGDYRKNLTFEGPITGNQITYTLYLPPGFSPDRGPYPLIVFLHGAGGANASPQVIESYETARKAGKIRDSIIVFPEKYPGTVWRDGAREKMPETNVLKELLPHLEKKYAVSKNRSQRTVMGFSMGAAGALYWGAKYLDQFSTAVALDSGGGTSTTDPGARNFVPEYAKNPEKVRESLRIRLVQGALNTRGFRAALDDLKIPYSYEQLPRDAASYPASSSCLSKKDPSKKFLHNPACLVAGAWGQATWEFIGESHAKEQQ